MSGGLLPLGARFCLEPGFDWSDGLAWTEVLRTENMPSSALSQATNSGEPEGTVPLLVVLRPPAASAEPLNGSNYLKLRPIQVITGHPRRPIPSVGHRPRLWRSHRQKTRPTTPAGYFVADRGVCKPPAECLLTSSPP
jgi:hypothetical protein